MQSAKSKFYFSFLARVVARDLPALSARESKQFEAAWPKRQFKAEIWFKTGKDSCRGSVAETTARTQSSCVGHAVHDDLL